MAALPPCRVRLRLKAARLFVTAGLPSALALCDACSRAGGREQWRAVIPDGLTSADAPRW